GIIHPAAVALSRRMPRSARRPCRRRGTLVARRGSCDVHRWQPATAGPVWPVSVPFVQLVIVVLTVDLLLPENGSTLVELTWPVSTAVPPPTAWTCTSTVTAWVAVRVPTVQETFDAETSVHVPWL